MTPEELAARLAPLEERLLRATTPATARFERLGGALLSVDPESESVFPSQNRNRVLHAGIAQPLEREALEAIRQVYRAAKAKRFFHYLSPSPQAEAIDGWLTEDGWTIRNALDVLLRPLDTPIADAPTELEIVAWDGAPLPEGADPWLVERVAQCAAQDGMVFLARDGALPVGVGMALVHDGLAYLGMVGTVEGHRGRGAQSALIAARLAWAREQGAAHAVSETYEHILAGSFRNLLRAGFTRLYARSIYAR